jgi:hypothetical protein
MGADTVERTQAIRPRHPQEDLVRHRYATGACSRDWQPSLQTGGKTLSLGPQPRLSGIDVQKIGLVPSLLKWAANGNNAQQALSLRAAGRTGKPTAVHSGNRWIPRGTPWMPRNTHRFLTRIMRKMAHKSTVGALLSISSPLWAQTLEPRIGRASEDACSHSSRVLSKHCLRTHEESG